MRNALLVLVMESVSMIFAGGSVYLCATDRGGWGWFMAASILTAVTGLNTNKKGADE